MLPIPSDTGLEAIQQLWMFDQLRQMIVEDPSMEEQFGCEFLVDHCLESEEKDESETSPDWPIFALYKKVARILTQQKFNKLDLCLTSQMPSTPSPPARLSSTISAEQQQKLFYSLQEKADRLIPLFGQGQLNYLGFLRLEQIIQIAWILLFIKGHQGRTCTSEESLAFLRCIATHEWQLQGGHEKMVEKFFAIWGKGKTEKDSRLTESLRSALSLLKQFSLCPACYQLRWNTQSTMTQETVQFLTVTFGQISTLFNSVCEMVEKRISVRLTDLQKRIFILHRTSVYQDLLFQRTGEKGVKDSYDIIKKDVKVYLLFLDWLRVLMTHSKLYRVRFARVQQVASWNADWMSCINDGKEVLRSLGVIEKIVTGYLQWSSVFTPTVKMSAKQITFLRGTFQAESALIPSIVKECAEVIEKYVKQNVFKKGEGALTQAEIKKYKSIAIRISEMCADVIEAQLDRKKVEGLKPVRILRKEEIPQFQQFVTDMIIACEQGVKLFLEQHLKWRQDLDALCPYGGSTHSYVKAKLHIQETVSFFRECGKSSHSQEYDTPATILLGSIYARIRAHMEYPIIASKSESQFQKFIKETQELAKARMVASDNANREAAALDNVLERENIESIIDDIWPLGSVTEVLCSDLLPMLDSCKDLFKTVLESAPKEEDDSWWFEIAEEFETPVSFEGELKAVKSDELAPQQSKKPRRKPKAKPQQKTSKTQLVPKAPTKPAQQVEVEDKLNCDMQARFLYTVSCGWGIGTERFPKDMCGKALDIINGSKYEYLRAMHSFQLRNQMLSRTKDRAAQRAVAVGFMHKGVLATEQLLVSTGTNPKHRLSTMLRALELQKGFKWDRLADNGSIVARYLGFNFRKTCEVDRLIDDVISEQQTWVSDAYAMQTNIFKKTANTKTQEIIELLTAIKPKPEIPQKVPAIDSRYAKRLESLKEKAASLEKVRQAIMRTMERYMKAENEIQDEMYKRLDTVKRSVEFLVVLPQIIEANWEQEYWLEHAEEALLRTQYIAENLGTYLVLLQRGVRQINAHHYLRKFMMDNQLGKDLNSEQTAVLEDICDIGKGSELPYNYSARHTPEMMCRAMSLLSDLYDLSYRIVFFGNGFTPVGGQALSSDKLEKALWKHLMDMMDLAEGLVKTTLMSNGDSASVPPAMKK